MNDHDDFDGGIHGELAFGLPDDFGRSAELSAEPRTHLRLNLLENGIDFIRSGVEGYFLEDRDDAATHKYAVLHLFAGVLLILKERLRRAHPALIFARVEDNGDDDRPTITLDMALVRLKSCAQVTITQKDAKLLTTVARIRNRLEHYEFEINLKQTQYLVGRMAEFVFLFLRDQLQTDLENHLTHAVLERFQGLREVAKRLDKERQAEWKRRSLTYKKMKAVELRALLQDTFYHPKDNPIPSQAYWCPECHQETVVGVGLNMAVCTNSKCRAIHAPTYCMRCEGLILEGSDKWLCESCQAYHDRN